MLKAFDVYSYGVVSSSRLYRIRGDFPTAEGYAEIVDAQCLAGGEATNSSIVLARLGARVRLDGNWLGDDENGRRTKALLSDYQIDTARLPLRKDYKGVQEVVFSADGTRTIFGTYGRLLDQAEWNSPREEDVTRAKVVCLDPYFAKPASKVAEVAFDAGIPVVVVDCQHDNPLLKHSSAVVIAESYLRENYADHDPANIFSEYQAATSGLVVFTFGDQPTWYARPKNPVKHFQPFAIDPVDTTGGGDSFRAGIVFGYLKGWNDDQMVEFASAVAAINCSRFPGVLNSPTMQEVSDFISVSNSGSSAQ